jgi:hypothetical protein
MEEEYPSVDVFKFLVDRREERRVRVPFNSMNLHILLGIFLRLRAG